MVSKERSSYSYVLTLFDPVILNVKNLRMPNLTTFVNYSNFTLIVVKFKQLNDFYLEIEIIKLSFFCLTNFGNIAKLGDKFAREDWNGCKLPSGPCSQALNDLFVFRF
jgi:hypothetical protein